MPVHQITVVPVSEEATSRCRSCSRDRQKSTENQVYSAPHRAVRTRTSLPSYTELSSPGTLVKSGEQGRAQTSDKIPPENTLDLTPNTKRHEKRQHRRRQRNGSCVSECAAHSGFARAHADSSSGEEQQRREARSWSREKARRRRRKRVLAQPQLRQDEAPREHGYEELQSKEANGGEEEPIMKAYEEQEAGDHDMAVPSAQKYTEAPGQNGATQQGQTDDELELCRICHCEGDQECPLIAPCRCTGTLRFVHHACLRQWIKSSDTHCCELCKYDFVMETHLKPLRKWETLQMSASEHRKIFCSVTFHLVSVACVLWSLYILAGRVTEELRKSRGANGSLDLSALAASGLLDWLFWTKVGMVAGGVAAGFVFMYVQGKVYLQLWRRLKAFNRVIFVQDCPETAHDGVQQAGAEPV